MGLKLNGNGSLWFNIYRCFYTSSFSCFVFALPNTDSMISDISKESLPYLQYKTDILVSQNHVGLQGILPDFYLALSLHGQTPQGSASEVQIVFWHI